MTPALVAGLLPGFLAATVWVPAVGHASPSPAGATAVAVTRESRTVWTSRGAVTAAAGQSVVVSGRIRGDGRGPRPARIVFVERAAAHRSVHRVVGSTPARTFRVTHRVSRGTKVTARIISRGDRPVRISRGRLSVVGQPAVSPPGSSSPGTTPPADPQLPPQQAGEPPQPPAQRTEQAPSQEGGGDGWRLYWSDEFSGQALDGSRWRAYHKTYGDGNNELACLTPDNVVVGGGAAAFVAQRERITCPGSVPDDYSSGFVGSREAGRHYPLYGRYEIRARIPHGQGLWPAFWLRHRLGADVAEVDVMEYFFSQVPGRTTQTLHFPSTVGRNVAKRSVFTETPVRGTGGWHTWAVEIEPVAAPDGTTDVRFRFLLDGAQTLAYVNPRPEAWTGGDPDRAWDIAVNLAVGGDWAGHPDRNLGYLTGPGVCSLTYRAPAGGDPASCPTTGLWGADLPARYVVDHVRVYTR